MNNLIVERKQLFDKLAAAMEKNDETEINYILDVLKLRFGIGGKERAKILEYFFSQVIELLLPMHMKYIFWVASDNLDIFTNSKNNDNLSMSSTSANNEHYTSFLK